MWLWMYLKVFVIGGLICAIGELLILRTKLTAARVLVGYVTVGAILGALGLYEPLVEFAGAGAKVPLSGFGFALADGAIKAVREKGFLGAFTGGVAATAGGIAAAVLFGYLFSVICNPKMKE